jgi:activator of HSP90 ATPase
MIDTDTDTDTDAAKENLTITRRRAIAAGAIAISGLVLAGARTSAQEKSGAITAAKAIHQEEDFKASPQRIYEALLDSKQFTALSGGRVAEIHREVGGTFSIFGGHIVGRNLDLVPNRRIVQAWRVVPWPEGIYSIARFELVGQSSASQTSGGPASGTRLIFDHTGFPSELAETLEHGWHENYWDELRKYLS